MLYNIRIHKRQIDADVITEHPLFNQKFKGYNTITLLCKAQLTSKIVREDSGTLVPSNRWLESFPYSMYLFLNPHTDNTTKTHNMYSEIVLNTGSEMQL